MPWRVRRLVRESQRIYEQPSFSPTPLGADKR